MEQNPKLKVWQLEIDENDFSTGVEYVALVDDPAILRMWQSFSALPVKYKIASLDRHIVQGPLMIPNMPIYRSDDSHGDHYVLYTKESVEKIVRKFFRQKNTGNVNLMHLPSASTKDVFMIDSFIIDASRGIKAPDGFENLPDGTWFGAYLIEDENIWKEVQAGTFKGFSVEGYFTYETSSDFDEARIKNMINAICNGTQEQFSYLSTKYGKMGLLSKIDPSKLTALKKMLFGEDVQQDASSGLLKDGTQVYAEGGFVQGAQIQVVTPEGNKPCPDGTYEMDNGTKIEVMNGVIMNVTEPSADQAQPEVTNEQMKAVEEKLCAFMAETKTLLEELQKSVVTTTASVAAFESKFSASENSVTSLRSDLKKVQDASKLIYEALESMPAQADATLSRDEQRKKLSDEKNAKIIQLSQTLKNLNKAK